MMTGRRVTDAQRAAARRSRERMLEVAKTRGRIGRYRMQTVLIMPIVWLLSALPVETASNIGGWIGRLLIPRVADIAGIKRTMRVPFPTITEAEANAHIRDMSENIGRVLGEALHLEAFAGRDNPRLTFTGLEHVDAARAQGRGILFVGGHFANWELFEVALANLGLGGAKVLQHPHNPFVLELVAQHRYSYGLDEQIASGEGVFVRVRDTLKAGRIVQMLADQRPHQGVRAPFFDLETTTNVVPGRAARETGAPIVLMSMRRLDPARFAIGFEPPRFFGPDEDEAAIATWINGFFEGELKAAPGHWLWGHPRWHDALKHEPTQPLVTPPSAG